MPLVDLASWALSMTEHTSLKSKAKKAYQQINTHEILNVMIETSQVAWATFFTFLDPVTSTQITMKKVAK
jgi:hypothetical protein